MADIGLVERVLTNLIDNALRHTSAGGAVGIAVEPEAERLWISVTDTGVGIAPEHLPRLFDRDSSLRRASGNGASGLGLIIVGKIVSLHGSRIQVDSVVNKGSTFRFDLPIARAVK
jgi:signal transduction histidine kinase